MTEPIRVTVWGENRHEHTDATVREIYPKGMHDVIAKAIDGGLDDAATVRTATLDEPEHGLSDRTLESTDVLTWWGHLAHADVADEIVARVRARVLAGMGLIVLHSAHESKIFKSLMGSTCSLHWREAGDREVVWNVNPSHPIASGISPAFVIPRHEMYGEYFDIPQPESLVFISSFTGGEVFRSGCCFTRGLGRIFYFSPGHETYPVYHKREIQRVICNAVKWAAPSAGVREEALTSEKAPLGWFEERQ